MRAGGDGSTSGRAAWRAFRDLIERTPSLSDDKLEQLLDRLHAQPDRWLERACVVTLVRGEREVLSDAQLRVVAARYGGKVATFIAAVLDRRQRRRAGPS